MDIVTGLPISTDLKGDSYDSIFVIVDRLTKIVHYKLVKDTIDVLDLAEVIIDVVVRYYDLSDSIVNDRSSLFTSKFWSLLCHFLGIKLELFTAFDPQIDGKTKRQNSTMKAYLQAFINFEQNNWARFLPMAEFAHNNAKNASTGHIPFDFNCGYHFCVSYEKDFNLCLKSKSAEELSSELWEMMTISQQNLHHRQELQKQAIDKDVKPQS